MGAGAGSGWGAGEGFGFGLGLGFGRGFGFGLGLVRGADTGAAVEWPTEREPGRVRCAVVRSGRRAPELTSSSPRGATTVGAPGAVEGNAGITIEGSGPRAPSSTGSRPNA